VPFNVLFRDILFAESITQIVRMKITVNHDKICRVLK
jgi:hypothetical protein